ncbi:hypothetical protein GCM10011390_10220 [Aureimonas endophytica]|uniref:Uncharacterized protein n=1 Tax=Aureimonas endophytica TaxID=2027858 RepID=A0A916ZFU4_9HYPH|nr:hypothetical protein [Aureimonas endophytica]GGD93400.1 hypothetical protein GCM10011390_10220 [Aureimonas endophytica]
MAMLGVEQYWFQVSMIGVPAVFVIAYLHIKLSYYRRRNRQLGLAARAMHDHVTARDRFLEDPAPSEFLKSFLLDYSDAISNEATATAFAAFYVQGKVSPRDHDPDLKKLVREEMTELKARPDLRKALDTAVMSGFVVLCMRWPGPARVFDVLMANVALDRKKGAAAAMDLSRRARDRRKDNDQSPTPPGIQLAAC